MYERGNGLYLYPEIVKDKDVDKVEYYAQAVDVNGIAIETKLKPRTTGDDDFLRAAFAGFGNCREPVLPDDFAKVPGLQDAFNNVLMPGEVPSVDVEEYE